MTESGQQRKLKGYIVALPRGSGGGEGARAALQTEDGVEYPILPRGMGLEIVEHINARVEVTGVEQRRGETVYLLLRSYTVEDAFEDDWYDDAP